MATGSCLCGKISYRVGGELRDVAACHCRQCRKQSGHYWAATNAQRDEIEIVGEGELTWFRASDSAARAFCSHCGSLMFWQQDGSETTSIGAGTLDEAPGIKLDRHIYVADKGSYYDVEDGTPQFAQDDRDDPLR